MRRLLNQVRSVGLGALACLVFAYGWTPLGRYFTNDNEGQIKQNLHRTKDDRPFVLGFFGTDGMPFGHATVCFNSLGRPIDPAFDGKYLGYHPARFDLISLFRMAAKRPVPGRLEVDFDPASPVSSFLPQIIKYPRVVLSVDEAGYRRAIQAAREWQQTHPDYVVGVSDCISFLAYVAGKAGLSVPDRTDGNMTPSVFLAELLARNLPHADEKYFIRQTAQR